MYLLVFFQNNSELPAALFATLEGGRRFLRSVHGYSLQETSEDGVSMVFETLLPAKLPDYMEVEYNGNRLPLSRFMFRTDDCVEIIWRFIPNMEQAGHGLVDGQTPVDAYTIANAELKSYIARREQNYTRITAALEKQGYETTRAFRGSEDGEAILYRKQNSRNWHFLMHMDPPFTEDVPQEDDTLRDWLDEWVQNGEYS